MYGAGNSRSYNNLHWKVSKKNIDLNIGMYLITLSEPETNTAL